MTWQKRNFHLSALFSIVPNLYICEMGAITVHPKDKSQLTTIKAFLKALKIPFEKAKEESPYNPEFVVKIKRSQKQAKEGKTVTYTLKQLDVASMMRRRIDKQCTNGV
ncbi:MAG: hypothetical protein EPN39_02290 [Chitinophagaceae bacterium]|nr:MAG: hypothetical protein EPN39_02290 [Chitinophagaceae bacterium]